jgi:ABC-2 type transport system ATP-binding protein
MARKLEIIRSLIHRPRVLFLDEPTVGLDPASRRNLWEYLARVRAEHETTVFLTTHYLDEAEDADRVCVINRGKVVALGTPAQLRSSLIQNYVLVDTADLARLRAELEARGLAYEGERELRIPLDGQSVHSLLKSIDTPLTTVKVHTPTLEDAYLSIVESDQ